MFDGIYFEFPKLIFVIFFFIACASLCKMKLPSLYFPHTASFMKNTASKSKLLFFLKWTAISMMIVALMSPVKDEPYELEPKDGYEMTLVLDASQSMQARGFDITSPTSTRFDVVKEIVSDFIDKRKNDNIGLVVFGAYSFIASPLTYDENILKGIVKELYIGMAGKYTALYESLAQGVNLLKMSDSKSKVIILLTDGFNTPDNRFPLDVALDMVKKEKIKVYPIGIGGQNEYNKQVLIKIAKESGGVAFGAANANELQDVYKRIDELEKSEIKNETFSYLEYYYIYPLFIGFLALMFYVYLRNKIGASE
ncbi:VWA domain-containing protein [Sulfurimonas lithotrophica]|uniref:VWA domain-containing protein n=1 Tax=Sulfurimonas lithotrophica TaxID=2590022 RepID=A0A5P8P071_9BACT|nr:VWA domain-containing protein [Sulfurimonas lithotrophica]QFR49084.1 VWA domain-containing protein [Sulfurimonas lithotrophica]